MTIFLQHWQQTGAGVSVSCGIPDFRSRDGVYARLAVDFPDLPDPQAMFDIHYFQKNPRPFFKFAREIYPGQFQPSPCHRFIKCIEKHGTLLRNYTQNIDTLEQVNPRIVEPGKYYWTRRLSMVDLLVQTSYDQFLFIFEKIPFF